MCFMNSLNKLHAKSVEHVAEFLLVVGTSTLYISKKNLTFQRKSTDLVLHVLMSEKKLIF